MINIIPFDWNRHNSLIIFLLSSQVNPRSIKSNSFNEMYFSQLIELSYFNLKIIENFHKFGAQF